MNLAMMLGQEVQTLSERRKEDRPRARRSGEDLEARAARCALAHQAKHAQAVARYKKVMGTEWTATKDIESRLGMGRSCCLPNLRRWEKEGLVKSRKSGSGKNWSRNTGLEWKFVK